MEIGDLQQQGPRSIRKSKLLATAPDETLGDDAAGAEMPNVNEVGDGVHVGGEMDFEQSSSDFGDLSD